ncbi:MAG: PKD domain-containing protein [Chitinophagia bacterium]
MIVKYLIKNYHFGAEIDYFQKRFLCYAPINMPMIRILIFTLLFCAFNVGVAHAQDFSNKGKEFWVVFPPHAPNGNNLAELSLYISSDKNTNGHIVINGDSIPFNITAFTPQEFILPRSKTYVSGAESATSDSLQKIVLNKGIKVIVAAGKPNIVVYAHMYASARSAASIILPTSVLEKKYQVISYTQSPQPSTGPEAGEFRRSQFSVVAIEDNSVIRIQLRKNGQISGTPFDVALPKAGTIYSFQDPVDLTGTSIESVSVDGSVCKKIAVFSGSSSVSIGNNGAGSVDPLYQQCYPMNSWGLNYFITPYRGKNKFIIRVLAKEDGTNVVINGQAVPLSANQFKEVAYTNQAAFAINSNKPVAVAQYSVTQTADIGVGDPDMVILNPVEQNINDVTVFLTPKFAITDQNINVVIKDEGIPTFKINGQKPTSTFVKIANTSYSYLQEKFTVANGTFLSIRLTSDSGFNAFCYGFGSPESYSYSAGTNVKDLFQKLLITNKFASVDANAVTCKGAPFIASITLPYKPNLLKWKIPSFDPVDDPAPKSIDSSLVSGKWIYTYKLNKELIYQVAGTYTIEVVVNNPLGVDGCSGEQEISFDLEVLEPPKALNKIITSNCLSDSVSFSDASIVNANDKKITNYKWDLGNNIFKDYAASFKFKYDTAGKYDVKFFLITEIGCVSDTIAKTIQLDDLPTVKFNFSSITCQNKEILFTDSSAAKGTTVIDQWIWNFGDSTTIDTLLTNTVVKHIYADAKKYKVKLATITKNGCQNALEKDITSNPNPVVGFIMPEICLEDSFAKFIDTTKIANNTKGFKYKWNFGDNANTLFPNTDSIANPKHRYLNTGNYNVSLQITSIAGCISADTSVFTVNGSKPRSIFLVQNDTALCSNKEVTIINNSEVDIGKVGRLIIYWDYDRDLLDTTIDENPIPQKEYKHRYSKYSFPDTTNFKIKLIAYTGGTCFDDTAQSISIVPPPSKVTPILSKNYVCKLDTLHFNADIKGGLTPFSKIWSVDKTSAANFSANILNGISPDNINISIKLVDPKKCEYDFNNLKNMSVRDIPIAILKAKDTVICNGDPITLMGAGGNTYNWLLNDITIYPTNTIDTFSTAQKGNYRLIVNDGFCNSVKSDAIFIKDLNIPVYTLSYNPYSCIQGNLVINTNAKDQNNVQFNWDFGDGKTFNQAQPMTHSYDKIGTYRIKLAVKNDYCPRYEYQLNGDSVKVVAPLPPSKFTLFVLADQDTLLSPKKIDSGYINYKWAPSFNLSNPFIPNPMFRAMSSIEYTLKRTDPVTECFINDLYYIDVSTAIVVSIPKAFTPNRDNLNDVLKIEYGAGLKTFNYFRIFNRFGKIIFQTNRLTDSWDGKFNGIDQEMDAYTYLIDYITYKDEHITKTGSFLLLR